MFRKFRVVDGTMEFNKHPGPEVFTTNYKLGPPISESLRKLEDEWALQKARLGSDTTDTKERLMTSSPGPVARRRRLSSAHPQIASTGQRGSPADLGHWFSSPVPLFGNRGAGAERGSSR